MKVVYLGDIMGRSGRNVVLERLPEIKERLKPDFIVVNGENAAAGFGITGKIANELFENGVDVISTGNHVWDQKETKTYINTEKRMIRPINYPEGTPGKGSVIVEDNRGRKMLVVNAMGRVFMDPLDDPFKAVDQELKKYPLGSAVKFVLVDMHAEATSEKMAMGQYLDGRASLVVGTHSHIPTADAQIFDGGTAYQTDAGMCGDYDSVIGMDKVEPINRFTKKMRADRYSPALGEATLCGVYVETDDKTGHATRIDPIRLGGRLKETFPEN
ncbi:TIGR00282 family metallophosphoesterase [Pseudemcibacter aquimaris]|uniref:TIGR00282 family metallophosphoesterase n=1 Tax=Pseudemcibacter aquimaris TaxID=2857064 RepID=UPI002011E4F7|nr:TIGR00282 family metallophosphoesterase [Pseudemcibacter aquimaris]MCC3862178.1 TIGR00282 family metallophosphoesterase [Pseudemcibacter aquimaris]WDU58931.1 TIGR00282 family metallophosphoesterase [Pseudemcibacter aquimaris]